MCASRLIKNCFTVNQTNPIKCFTQFDADELMRYHFYMSKFKQQSSMTDFQHIHFRITSECAEHKLWEFSI